MQQMYEHIRAFTDQVNRKGYDGYFVSSSGFTDTLMFSLISHVLQCYEEGESVAPLSLQTYSHWESDQHRYVKCDFHTDFSDYKGFVVRKMDIEYGNEYGPIKKKELQLLTSEHHRDIPTRDEVNKMMMQKKQLKH